MAASGGTGMKYVPFTSNMSSAASYVQAMRRCFCQGHCPFGEETGTCELRTGGVCFASAEAIYDQETDTFEPVLTFGCLADGEGSIMQCKGDLVPHAQGKTIECCDTDMCNKNLTPMYKLRTTTNPPSIFDPAESLPVALLLTTVTVCVVLFLLVIAVIYLRHRHREKQRKKQYYGEKNLDMYGTETNLMDQSSGSGSGFPILVQRTISKQIQMVQSVGKGRYGEVWMALWRGGRVAVKVFFTTEEQAWCRETEIYQTVLMRHDNILGFIAADIKGTGSWTQMLLITDYHERGSLFDYLQTRVLDPPTLLLMAASIASGLAHLHTEIFGTRGKPAIAHRDIKSKNILVKRNGECCIADFGLAVKYLSDTHEIDVPPNIRSGTRRYMAPEILDQSIDLRSFEAHKMGDMYAFGLVLWEMTRRCVVQPDGGGGEKISTADGYEVPYHEYVANDPSFDDMMQVVCVKKIRPTIPTRWEKDEVLSTLAKVMQECWHSNAAVRLTALRVKKTLAKLDTDTSIKIV